MADLGLADADRRDIRRIDLSSQLVDSSRDHAMNIASENVVNEQAVRILLIEDDEGICLLLEEYLEEHGYAVRCVHDGLAAMRKLERENWNLVLLDIMLPGLSGLEVLQRLRRSSDVPVILLTALGEESDRVAGLDGGADDYIVKPFSPRELLARIESVLRRSGMKRTARPSVIDFGVLSLECNRRELHVKGTKVDLSDQEFDTLLLLFRHNGRVVPRDEMTRTLLGRNPRPFDRAIDIRMSRLRQKLVPFGDCIRGVRGVGYEFIPPTNPMPGAPLES
jgi:DNA-binding response OmpR family regulator